MKISEIITDKYKLRMPPTVYYDLLADVLEAEEEQEPKTGHWNMGMYAGRICSACAYRISYCDISPNFCPNCGADMREGEE